MAGRHVLIVEDEPDILDLISFNLRKAGYSTDTAVSGEQALAFLREKQPDVVILDLMLPGMDGMEVCRRMKRDGKLQDIPIVMLTAKTEESDIVSGLEIGADDYLTKPFSPKVLLARVRTVLRRFQTEKPSLEIKQVSIHGINIDTARHEVYCNGKPVDLSVTEFRILTFLSSNPGWVFSRNQIINAVRGEDYPVTERSVDVQILGIRKKLEGRGKHIVTVRGVGYKMEEEKQSS